MSRRFMPIVLGLLLLLAPTASFAQRGFSLVHKVTSLELADSGVVKEILKSNVIQLDNEQIYVLDNIRIPLAYDTAAIEYLTQHVLNKRVKVYASRKTSQTEEGRFGKFMTHVLLEDGSWVQADMVGRGLAWAYSTPSSRDLVTELYTYEPGARHAKLGLWANPTYAIKNENTIKGTYDTFQVYEGTILRVSSKSNYSFINFGEDVKTDFTIVIKGEAFPLFQGNMTYRFDPAIWTGHRIRIRGWVEQRGGPMMYLTHPEQIQFLAQ